MSETENKALLSRYITEVWENADVGALRRFLSPDFERHLSPLAEPLGIEAQIERLSGLRRAFPDVTIVVEDVVAEGDRVAFRSTMTGTHLGEFAGIPPTGTRFTVSLVDIIRVENGLFAEQWGGPDMSDLTGQLRAT